MFPPGTPYDKRTFSFLSPLPFESVSLPLTIIGDPTLVDCEEVEIEINAVLEVDGVGVGVGVGLVELVGSR